MRLLALGLVALVLAGCASLPPQQPAPHDVTLAGARFETELGTITAILFPEDAPKTVALMQTLVAAGYYDGRAFGRVVPGHVIQVTDAGGLGLTEDMRTVPLEISPRLNFSAGALGIARGADPNSGGSEFFVMDYATSHLRGNYTVWGQVVEGLDVVHAVARVQAVAAPPQVPPEARPLLPFDRVAVQPPKIVRASLVNVTLSAADAAGLPLRVGQNVLEGDHRHSLEWPTDLRAGNASRFTWYVRPVNGSASLDPATLTLRIEPDHATPALTPQAGLPDILAWTWTPPAAGEHRAVLGQQGRDLASIAFAVAP